MARAPKPLELQASRLSKEETEQRKKAEEKLKGTAQKVYKAPKNTPKEVQKIYKNLTNELKKVDILNDLDIDLLLVTSHAIYEMERARKILHEQGSVITEYDEFGNVVKATKHPAVQVIKDFQAIFHTGCLQLGLSPSSRTKLAMMNIEVDGNKGNEIDDLFGGL